MECFLGGHAALRCTYGVISRVSSPLPTPCSILISCQDPECIIAIHPFWASILWMRDTVGIIYGEKNHTVCSISPVFSTLAVR
jgi:hypothetical protein